MVRTIIGAICCILWIGASAEPAYTEGQHYERITPEVTTHADGKIEVVEVFWYGCHHCFAFEPFVKKWNQSLPDNVSFRRVPGVFAENWKPHARAFYTAQALGVMDKIHGPLFEAIHEQKKKISDAESLERFFVAHGVAEADFREAYNSFSVDTKTRQATAGSKEYGITGVPSMIVDGRFRTSARLSGGYEELLKVVDFLVDKQSSQ